MRIESAIQHRHLWIEACAWILRLIIVLYVHLRSYSLLTNFVDLFQIRACMLALEVVKSLLLISLGHNVHKLLLSVLSRWIELPHALW